MVTGIFSKKIDMRGNLDWSELPLPYVDSLEGEEIAAYLGGFIFSFTGETSYDNLASCVTNQSSLLNQWSQAADSLMDRHNDDVSASVAHMIATIQQLDQNVAQCSEETQAQIDSIKSTVADYGTPDEAKIIANLTDSKDHVELQMAKMKMHAAMHNYLDYGVAFTDVFITLALSLSSMS